MDFLFRQAVPAECADVERVLRAAFTPYMRRLGREIPAGYHPEWLPASIERGDVFVADEAGRIVGVAETERRDTGLYLERLAVEVVVGERVVDHVSAELLALAQCRDAARRAAT